MSRITVVVLLTALFASPVVAAEDAAAVIERMIRAAQDAEQAGEDARAEVILRAVVDETEKAFGEDVQLAGQLERLALFLSIRKRPAEPRAIYQRALAIREQRQGKDHPDVATTLFKSALNEAGAEDRDVARVETLLDRALTIREKANGADDLTVAEVLDLQSLWFQQTLRLAWAERALTRAAAIREQPLGAESLRFAATLDGLGRIHMNQMANTRVFAAPVGRPPDVPALPPVPDEVVPNVEPVEVSRERHGRLAESSFKRALAIREKSLPPGAPEIAESLAHLGELEIRRGHLEEGTARLERWIAAQDRAKVPANFTQAMVLLRLVETTLKSNKPTDAERWLAKLQDNYAQLNGDESEQVLSAVIWRAETALQCGRLEATAQFLDRALAIETAGRGRNEPELLEARALMTGRYTDGADDPKGYLRWHRLKMFGRLEDLKSTRNDTLSNIIRVYGQLLHRANRAVPRPTDDDLAYFKQRGIVSQSAGIDSLLDRLTLADVAPEHSLDDVGLSHVERLFDLEMLTLDSPMVTDAGLVHLRPLPYLCCLYISSPAITDTGLSHLGRIKSLESLWINSARVTDAGLAHLTALPNLRELDLLSAGITDPGLVHFEKITTLRKLRLCGTKVTQEAVDRLQRTRPDLEITLETKRDN